MPVTTMSASLKIIERLMSQSVDANSRIAVTLVEKTIAEVAGALPQSRRRYVQFMLEHKLLLPCNDGSNLYRIDPERAAELSLY